MTIDKHELIKAKLKPGCICKGIKLVKILEAINKGAKNFQKIAEVTGIGNGSCQSRRCGEKVRELLGKVKITTRVHSSRVNGPRLENDDN